MTLLAIAAPAPGQSVLETLWRDFALTVPSDAWHVYSAPLRLDRDDLSGILWLSAATLAVGAFDADIQNAMREHPSSLPVQLLEPFTELGPVPLRDEGSGLATIGDTRTLLWFSGGLYALGLATGSDAVREAGLGCATADGVNSVFRQLLYAAVARDRPGLKQPDESIVLIDDPYRIGIPGGPWNQHSFFGGHAANPMSCATFWSRRYDLGWLEPVLYGAAGAVGVARMVDERHWASDTLLGLAFGYGVGKSVAGRYHDRARQKDASGGGSADAAGVRASFSLRPLKGGLYLGARVAF